MSERQKSAHMNLIFPNENSVNNGQYKKLREWSLSDGNMSVGKSREKEYSAGESRECYLLLETGWSKCFINKERLGRNLKEVKRWLMKTLARTVLPQEEEQFSVSVPCSSSVEGCGWITVSKGKVKKMIT